MTSPVTLMVSRPTDPPPSLLFGQWLLTRCAEYSPDKCLGQHLLLPLFLDLTYPVWLQLGASLAQIYSLLNGICLFERTFIMLQGKICGVEGS